ncbi:MAG: hypothetical protein QG671_402 [Actinomycetota bacterium]|nr:hypothetical protein [Actinomycetota bacterium]
MIALARLLHEHEHQWVVTADQRTWTDLDEFEGQDITTLADAIHAYRSLAQNWPLTRRGRVIDPSDLVAPVVHPGKIVGVDANYATFGPQARALAATELTPTMRFPTAIVGPRSPIAARSDVTPLLDYAVELALVIADHIPVGSSPDDPMQAVFGYTVANELSAHGLADGLADGDEVHGVDAFLAVGPWITLHTDRLAPLEDRAITTHVNGLKRQDAHLGTMVRDIPALLRGITRSMSLDPGDVVLTGSPPGRGASLQPPRFLQDRDVVSCAITGLGRINNTVQVWNPRARPPARQIPRHQGSSA